MLNAKDEEQESRHEAMMIPNQMKEKISKIRVMIMCKYEEVEQCKDKKYVY